MNSTLPPIGGNTATGSPTVVTTIPTPVSENLYK
jgi:hypothetical protein